jgi:hypothetical protein
VAVRIYKSREEGLALEIHSFGTGRNGLKDFREVANSEDFSAANGYSVGIWILLVRREDLAVE